MLDAPSLRYALDPRRREADRRASEKRSQARAKAREIAGKPPRAPRGARPNPQRDAEYKAQKAAEERARYAAAMAAYEAGAATHPRTGRWAFEATLTQSRRAMLHAARLGYTATPEGHVYNARGHRLYSATIGVTLGARHKDGKGRQHVCHFWAASLAGYVKYGRAYLDPGACLIFEDGDPGNLAFSNLRLATREQVAQAREYKRRQARLAAGEYLRLAAPIPRSGRGHARANQPPALSFDQAQALRHLLDSGRITRKAAAARLGLTYDAVTYYDIGSCGVRADDPAVPSRLARRQAEAAQAQAAQTPTSPTNTKEPTWQHANAETI